MDARLCNTQRNRKYVQRAILQYFSDYSFEQRKKDWILVAKLLDQFLFVCFIVIFTAVTIAFVATESTNQN